MAARFILSFDCEGKWGVADHLTPADHEGLCDARLRRAYEDIVALLDEFDVAATFAFVGCFSMDAGRLAQARPALEALARATPGYIEYALEDSVAGSRQGWTGDWAVEAAAGARTAHEIALHGVTHVPWNRPDLTAAVARQEMRLLFDAKTPIAARATTWIYPRNGHGHEEVLDEFGIAGLREARLHASRAASLLSELNLLARPDTAPAPARPLRIPAGYFVNWLSGPRALIPPALSRARARLMLRRAARDGSYVHYWTHPENIATAPATLGLLRGIVEDVARLRDAGLCEVMTQDAYCRAADPAHVAASEARRDAQLQGASAPSA